MKKLLVVSDTFLPMFDGVTTFIRQVVPRLKGRFDIELLVPEHGESGADSWLGMKVHRVPVCRRVTLAGYALPMPRPFAMLGLVRKTDIVFVQSGPVLGAAAVLCAWLFRKPVVMYLHQIGWEQVRHVIPGPRWLKRAVGALTRGYACWMMNRCDRVIVPGPEVETLLRELGVEPDIDSVPLGVDIEVFRPPHHGATAKRAAGMDPERVVIGYCGRISREKGMDTLIAAFGNLNAAHPNVSLLIVGEGEEALESAINAVPNTRITGFVDNVTDYYHCMDIFVFPSLTETTGLSLLEALACELPVVTTPVGFALRLRDKHDACIFPMHDVPALQDILGRLVADENERGAIARAGRHTVASEYTWADVSSRIDRVLTEAYPAGRSDLGGTAPSRRGQVRGSLGA